VATRAGSYHSSNALPRNQLDHTASLLTYFSAQQAFLKLHTLVSAGGLHGSSIRWIPDLDFGRKEHRHELMLAWQFALIVYLEAAITASVLRSALSADQLTQILEIERRRT
jgi:hypothetical protein